MYHYLDVKIIANQDVYSNILQIKTLPPLPPTVSRGAAKAAEEGCLAGTADGRGVQKEVAVVGQIYCFLMAVKERRSWWRGG